MPRRTQQRHPNKEAPEPLKRLISAVINITAGCLVLLAILLIAEYVTDPQVLTFDFLFR